MEYGYFGVTFYHIYGFIFPAGGVWNGNTFPTRLGNKSKEVIFYGRGKIIGNDNWET